MHFAAGKESSAMARTLRRETKSQAIERAAVVSREEMAGADDGGDVLFLDGQGGTLSLADLKPVSEEERKHLGFPFDVPDELNDAESDWIRQQRSRKDAGKR
jgi:hypothetical protein